MTFPYIYCSIVWAANLIQFVNKHSALSKCVSQPDWVTLPLNRYFQTNSDVYVICVFQDSQQLSLNSLQTQGSEFGGICTVILQHNPRLLQRTRIRSKNATCFCLHTMFTCITNHMLKFSI